MAGDTEIAFTAKSFAGAMLGADSEVFPLDNARRIMISVSDSKRVRMLKGRNVYYFDRLQSLF
jgi:hypothetical protein